MHTGMNAPFSEIKVIFAICNLIPFTINRSKNQGRCSSSQQHEGRVGVLIVV